MSDPILTVAELADEWMHGDRLLVRVALSKAESADHAVTLFASIFEVIEGKYGEEHARQFCKAFAAH